MMAARPHIVILGGGFAGSACAQALQDAQRSGLVDVTLVDRQNYMVFSPLLVEAGTGALEPRHAVAPLRRMIGLAEFRMAQVLAIDTQQQQVELALRGLQRRQRLRYDHLVIALGSVTRLPHVPGLHEYGYEMKSMSDAVALRDRAIQMLELASAVDRGEVELRRELLSFVVVGGNFTGVDVAGEYHHLLRRALRRYRHIDPALLRMVLVEREPRLLTQVDPRLSQYAQQELSGRGIEIRLNTSAVQLGPDYALLSNGERLATRTVIWCAGVAPNPLALEAQLPRVPGGWVQCTADLRCAGLSNVWAIGDVANNPDPQGKPYPPTAQHAVPMGKHVAGNILRVLRGQSTQPFVHKSRGMLAALGGRDAVGQVGNLHLRGGLAWFLWRGFYLWQMPGLSRKIRVALDWAADLVLGHDLVQLGVHRASAREAEPQEPEVRVKQRGEDAEHAH